MSLLKSQIQWRENQIGIVWITDLCRVVTVREESMCVWEELEGAANSNLSKILEVGRVAVL